MERDDIIEYSLDAHHSEEQGAKIRKKIWFVTALLTVITAVEVALGAYIKQGSGAWPFVKWSFIIMTLLKAGYIVSKFLLKMKRNLNITSYFSHFLSRGKIFLSVINQLVCWI